jgi:hypothetical protein
LIAAASIRSRNSGLTPGEGVYSATF